jgi:endonuclease-3
VSRKKRASVKKAVGNKRTPKQAVPAKKTAPVKKTAAAKTASLPKRKRGTPARVLPKSPASPSSLRAPRNGARALEVLAALKRAYPSPRCALDHQSAFQLLVATILSAQCTDVRVNAVTPELFRRFPDAERMAEADPAELMGRIRSTGFYNNKTRSLLGMSRRLVAAYGGRVPDTMEDLLTLPGVARKTANVVLGTWFGKNEGVVVDTHVHRLSHRIGLTRETDPVRIEQDLMALFPREEWTDLSHRLIDHGRRVCRAPIPACAPCVLGPDLCPSYDPDPARWRARMRSRREAEGGRAPKPAGKRRG